MATRTAPNSRNGSRITTPTELHQLRYDDDDDHYHHNHNSNNKPSSHLHNLKSQDDQLWKIIKKQRLVIKDLREALTKVSAERDSLLARAAAATHNAECAVSSLHLHQPEHMTDDEDALSSSPSTSSCCSSSSSSTPAGPVPPPRSPYRQNHPQFHRRQQQQEQLRKNSDDLPPNGTDSLTEQRRKNCTARSSSLPVSTLSRSISPTPTMIVTSPVNSIVDQDAHMFAHHQEPLQRAFADGSNDPKEGYVTAEKPYPSWPWPVSQTCESRDAEIAAERHVRRASSQPAIAFTQRHIEASPFQATTPPPPPPPTPSSPAAEKAMQQRQQILTGVTVRVLGSNITTNQKGKGVVSFVISVRERDEKELWCIEKLYSDFLALDNKLKSQCRSRPSKVTKLPDKALFATHAPSKSDQRKAAIENYLQRVLAIPWSDISALNDFLRTNKISRKQATQTTPGYKEGYLTKRAKTFGGWKTRYFILENSSLRFYDNQDGALLGTIHIPDTRIRRCNPLASSNDPHHAFLIEEPKKAASPTSGVNRHLLCAESDKERDDWVEVLTKAKDPSDLDHTKYHPPRASSVDSAAQLHQNYLLDQKQQQQLLQRPELRPRSSMDHAYHPVPTVRKYTMPTLGVNRRGSMSNASQAVDDSEIHDGKKKKSNRKTFWAKKMATGIPSTNSIRGLLSRNSSESSSDPTSPLYARSSGKPSKVFGVPLEEAIQVSRISDKCELPSIIYRCIEYLEANNATQEEGIYRLSGSAVKIKMLKEQFDQAADVCLLNSDEYLDIHAVAGVLKLWLRELPGNVLTQELLKEFLPVIDLVDRDERVRELGRLVSMLPLANYTLLRILCAHLIRVVQYADLNKMTARNVGIIFSPTLQIPAGIFSLFLSEFEYIFWTKNDNGSGKSRDERPSSENQAISAIMSTSAAPLHPTQPVARRSHVYQDEDGRSNRNSVHYMDSTPLSIVGLEKGNAVINDDEDDDGADVDDFELQNAALSDDDDDVYEDDDNEINTMNQEQQPHEIHNQDYKDSPFAPSGQLLAMK
ncbi:hypothetical protein BX666DRAFT_758859 [Dichotomocladium elegans]|nr:hypothetical protein BX666DRAFT_758859 [Dichotomocladium elegans]